MISPSAMTLRPVLESAVLVISSTLETAHMLARLLSSETECSYGIQVGNIRDFASWYVF